MVTTAWRKYLDASRSDSARRARELRVQAERPPTQASEQDDTLELYLDWIEARHLQIMANEGFDDVRRAHNAVFVNLPAEGRRLTELADVAGLSKQAMSELVNDLVDRGYLARTPDPTDGRAKLIVWAQRGDQAHEATLRTLAAIERELATLVGSDVLDRLTNDLLALVGAIRAAPSSLT